MAAIERCLEPTDIMMTTIYLIGMKKHGCLICSARAAPQ